jgi:hypothetical protein
MQDVGRLGDQVAAEQDGVGDGFRAANAFWALAGSAAATLTTLTEGFFSAFSVVRYLSKR